MFSLLAARCPECQLNPHFLFNTLNSIYGMSLTASKEAPASMCYVLADMMRYTLYDCREDKVELEKDLAFTDNYIAMEKKRYPMSDIRFTVSNNSEGVLIAPLLLIPLLRTVSSTGAHRLNDSSLYICCNLQVDTERLYFIVEERYNVSDRGSRHGSGGIGVEKRKKASANVLSGKTRIDN